MVAREVCPTVVVTAIVSNRVFAAVKTIPPLTACLVRYPYSASFSPSVEGKYQLLKQQNSFFDQ